jgi:hypothetical protein
MKTRNRIHRILCAASFALFMSSFASAQGPQNFRAHRARFNLVKDRHANQGTVSEVHPRPFADRRVSPGPQEEGRRRIETLRSLVRFVFRRPAAQCLTTAAGLVRSEQVLP